jgi:RNA recognition motif-containing protein
MGSEIANIFIGNLDFAVEDADLQKIFESFGRVIRAHVICDHRTGHSRGFGFIEMENGEEAGKAIEALSGTLLLGRPMRIDKATRRVHPSRD